MKPTFKNLAFRGGGVKGIAYGGALEELDAMGLYAGVERVSGTSAGAITSLLVGLRYPVSKIMDVLWSTSFKEFMDKPDPLRVATKYGYYKGEFALNWLHELVKNSPLGLDANATFADLKAAGGRDTFLYATDVNTHSAQELSFRESPDTMLAEAARASMSIPMFFEAFQFSNSKPNDHIYVDGGMVLNFPLSIFDEKEFLPAGQESGPNPESLGFYFIPEPGSPPTDNEFGYNHLIKFVVNNFETILKAQIIDYHLDPTDVKRTVEVSDCSIKATDFDLSKDDKTKLVQAGKAAVVKYMKQYEA
ncbi:MAG: patatin-like phospholipase family protein [Bacteroidia bacterium]|nr:patatin-like phospholipase family protein [Bacteroidia bacterium]